MKYVIGDVHANYRELEKLIKELGLTADDELIFLGDYIGKNPDTKETLKLIFELDNQRPCTFLRGNHDFVWEQYLLHGEQQRNEFLLMYGDDQVLGADTANTRKLLAENDIKTLENELKDYTRLLARLVDFLFIDEYLIIHAGLLPDQLRQSPLEIIEKNYFIRPKDMKLDERYLDSYTVVAGHTFLSKEPTIHNGYINVDLGGGHGGYLGAFNISKKQIIRSDGKIFTI